jgi:hypothetical protein
LGLVHSALGACLFCHWIFFLRWTSSCARVRPGFRASPGISRITAVLRATAATHRTLAVVAVVAVVAVTACIFQWSHRRERDQYSWLFTSICFCTALHNIALHNIWTSTTFRQLEDQCIVTSLVASSLRSFITPYHAIFCFDM